MVKPAAVANHQSVKFGISIAQQTPASAGVFGLGRDTMEKLMRLILSWIQASKAFFRAHWLVGVSIFLAVSVVGVMWPQYEHSGPALIDDGADLLQTRRLSLQQIVEIEIVDSQRTWPLRMAVRELLYSLFGTHAGLHFVAMSGVLWATLFSVVLLVRRANLQSKWILLLLVLLMISPTLYDNYYRLGTGEPIQFLLFLLGLLALEYRWYWTAVLIFAISLFSKETSLFYSLSLVFELMYFKKKWQLAVILPLLAGFAMMLFYKLQTMSDAYVARAGFDLGVIVMSLSPTSLTFKILAGIFVLVVLAQRYDRARVRLMVAYFLTFLPLFIWPINQFYYLFLNHSLGLICGTVLLHDIISNGSRLKKYVGLGLASLFLFLVVWPSARFSLFTMQAWYQEYAIGGALANYLLTTDLSTKDVYVAVSDFERHDKIFVYLNYWKEGPHKSVPASVDWLSIENDVAERGRVAHETREQFFASSNPQKLLITTTALPEISPTEYSILSFCSTPFFKRKECWYHIYQPRLK